VPVFPGARELAAQGILSGGSKRGRAALADVVSVGAGVDPVLVDIAYDAETSGGLLICVGADAADALERELAARRVPVHAVGEVVADTGNVVELV